MASSGESNGLMQQSLSSTSNENGDNSTISGYEGKRMKILRSVMNKTVKSYTSKLRLVKYLSNVSSKHLEKVHQNVIQQLEENILSELEQVYQEENVEKLLNTLDRLIEDAQTKPGTTVWRPSGDVQTDTRSVVAVLKREKLRVLQTYLADFEAQNKLLREQLMEKEKASRDKIVAIAEDMERIVDKEGQSLKSQHMEKD